MLKKYQKAKLKFFYFIATLIDKKRKLLKKHQKAKLKFFYFIATLLDKKRKLLKKWFGTYWYREHC